jgi:hypothetical protein
MIEVIIAFIGGAIFGYAIIKGIVITLKEVKKHA